jgi:5'-3' exonuclease
MAILVDYNQVMLASLFAGIGNHTDIELNENLLRHMFLNSIRFNRKKFHKEYGEIVLCVDNKDVWRRDYFPYYKANRKKSRDESDLDWNKLFESIHMIREEITNFFPYKVIYIERCEADDIIATIIHENGMELNTGAEKFLILSGDKDFIQLHKYANVDQYDPVRKRWIRNDNPDKYLQEHILKGDVGDGVPNILSADNTLAIGERQKPMTAKRMGLFIKEPENMDEETKLRFNRNKKMIDLSQIPQEFKDRIIEEYAKEKEIGREHLFNFFIKKQLKNLITDIQDF